MTRICLVGAGFISGVHAAAIQDIPGLDVSAIVDTNAEAAARLARQAAPRAAIFKSIEEAISARAFDRAHVLVPPHLHAAVALPILRAGFPVLLEKPIAANIDDCQALLDAGGVLGTNQNFVFHPAFARLRSLIGSGALGRLRHVTCTYNVPLRQLAAGQVGHWMFQAPVNILLEQAVHPLSQILTLAGPIEKLRALAGPSLEIRPGQLFYPSLDAAFACRDATAQLRFAVGQDFPFWQLSAICTDGVGVADILANRMFTYGRIEWMEALDGAISASRTARSIAWDGIRNAINYALSITKLKGRSDPFFLSMRSTIASFHAAVDKGQVPELDGRFGAALVSACQNLADDAFVDVANKIPSKTMANPIESPDVVILGGTGFIGTHVVRRFVKAGMKVRVMARSIGSLPALFDDPLVSVVRGDIRDPDAVARAVGSAKIVVNLAHGGGGSTWEEVRDAMVGGTQAVAQAVKAAAAVRFVHVGSIASLYLGPQNDPITGKTPPDPQEQLRGDYARAKVLCDRLLLDLHQRDRLPVCILRPGIVVGEGGIAFHSGVGLFNNEQHCIGWNSGRNPLPFVLAEDVAEAVFLSASAPGVEGRCYNLVGPIQPTARDYIRRLGMALGRPLVFHPQLATRVWIEEVGKWLVKRLTGRKLPIPARRDFLSRGMLARFDTQDVKQDLNWMPVNDESRFWARAVEPHAK